MRGSPQLQGTRGGQSVSAKHWSNSYRLAENLPNAVLLTYPDAGHGSLFQYPESFTRHSAAFLASNAESAAF
jgi:pimeloyl-ACP methyl ester carboxylesterase